MEEKTVEHYYGDKVRTLFIIGGLIMLASYPFFSSLINAPMPIAILACLALAVFGGLMNPEQKWVIFLNTVIPLVAFLVFEYYAVYAYNNLSSTESIHVAFFWVNLDGFISFANDHALKILKIDSKEIEKTNLASIFASNEDVNKILLMESDRPLKLQTNLISRDKEIIPTQLNAVLIKALNNPIGYILIADDIHLREIMNARLEMEKCKKSADDHSRIHHEYSEKINKLAISNCI
ncbi:MAG: hypothetical protein UU07_C0024G0015, partial [Parcubacteria group bacterium GW2011_GWF1_40_5]